MRVPDPSRRDHQRFCEVEGWVLVSSATSRRGTHHDAYELALPSGEILRTRVSRPPDRTAYGPSLWGHVLRDQLKVTEEGFWRCVRDRLPPDRGVPKPAGRALPADLAWHLGHHAGVSEEELAGMTREEAVARMLRYWTQGE